MTDTTTLHIAEISYPSGSVRYRYTRKLSPDGQRWIRHGRFEHYAESGTLLSEGNYIDGMEDGRWRDFHPNGQLAAEGLYAAGKESGVWRYWSVDGLEEPGP
jgi:antitoxin component YwqK of YwqJK toxin-antitoxin module